MKLFRTRELLSRYPVLDKIRMDFLGWIANAGTTFFDRSWPRITIVSPGARSFLETRDCPVIYAIYHGCMVGALDLYPRQQLAILISESRDGEMIARGARGLGFTVVRGSPAQGAVKGTLALIDAARQGRDLAFMVDGPRGPAYAVKPGIMRLARMAGIPIVPYVTSARNHIEVKTWDHYLGPCWGSPVLNIIGNPVFVPDDAPDSVLEDLRLALEQELSGLKAAADSLWTAGN